MMRCIKFWVLLFWALLLLVVSIVPYIIGNILFGVYEDTLAQLNAMIEEEAKL